MKENGWKALVLAATIFLTSSCYSIKKAEKENKQKTIDVISIKNILPEVQNTSIPKTHEIVFINPTQKIEPVNNITQEISIDTSLDKIAYEVINGNWGNGELRKQLLTESGYDYNKVMQRVNQILGYGDTIVNIDNLGIMPNQNYNISGPAAYLNNDCILYDSNNSPICTLNKYDKVILGNSFIGSKILVTIPYLHQGYLEMSSLTYLPSTYIEVDISLQLTRMYIDNELIFEANVITGNPNKGTTPGTNLGCSQILRKDYQTYLVGDGYKEYVDVFMPFNYSEEGFHDADGWRNNSQFDDKTTYLTNGSHGCVNMRDADAKRLSELADVGTLVLVHK